MGKNETVLEQTKPSDIHPNQRKEDAATKIETIRNLIFGDNIEEYNSEFESLKSDILQKKKILEGLIEEVSKELKTAIDTVATDVNIRITELEDKLEERIESLGQDKVDRNELGKMLKDLGERVSQK
ncbi:MAG: fructose 1,6-bisphosphatase [Pricia sp.]